MRFTMQPCLETWIRDNLPTPCHDAIPYLEAKGYFTIDQLTSLVRDNLKWMNCNEGTVAYLRKHLQRHIPEVDPKYKKRGRKPKGSNIKPPEPKPTPKPVSNRASKQKK